MMAYGNYAPFYRAGYFNPMQPITQQAYQPMAQENNQYVPQYQQGQPIQQMQQTQMPYQTSQQPNNEMIWVQGEAGAKAYLVAPNNTVILWDSENSTIYVKSADVNGIPSMRTLDFTERNSQANQKPQERTYNFDDKFVTKEDFKTFQDDFEMLKDKVETLQNKKNKKVEVTDNE